MSESLKIIMLLVKYTSVISKLKVVFSMVFWYIVFMHMHVKSDC